MSPRYGRKTAVTAWLIVPVPGHFQGWYPVSRMNNFPASELMKLQSLRFHFARLARELGSPVSIGTRRYRVKGYLPSQFAVDMGHEPYLAKPWALQWLRGLDRSLMSE